VEIRSEAALRFVLDFTGVCILQRKKIVIKLAEQPREFVRQGSPQVTRSRVVISGRSLTPCTPL